MVIFLSQISAAIVGFTLISKSTYLVSGQLHNMITGYNNQYYGVQQKIDWIQSKVSYALFYANKQTSEINKILSLSVVASTVQVIGKSSNIIGHLISLTHAELILCQHRVVSITAIM